MVSSISIPKFVHTVVKTIFCFENSNSKKNLVKKFQFFYFEHKLFNFFDTNENYFRT